MFESKGLQYNRIPGDESPSSENVALYEIGHQRHWFHRHRSTLLLFFLLLSLISNSFQLFRNRELVTKPDMCRSTYSMGLNAMMLGFC